MSGIAEPAPWQGALAERAFNVSDVQYTRRGWAAALLVVLLASFLAASPVRNTDFWLHLASGKAIAQGNWQADPFSYTSEQAKGNPCWLYDLLCYWLYVGVGESGLLAFKYLLVAGLALVLMAGGRIGNSIILPAFATALSMIALGPWLSFKPLGVSILFLASTFYVLERNLRWQTFSWRSYWPLFPLFALWVNMDRWFILGPAVVALYGVASFFPSRRSVFPNNRERGTMTVVVLASVAACLASPYGIANLQLPPELLASDSTKPLHMDYFLREQFIDPFAAVYSPRHFFQYPAGLAYWALAVLSLGSFALVSSPFRWQRFLAWSSMFGLSLFLNLGVPFFAVVAAPILALNCGERMQQGENRVIRLFKASSLGLAVVLALLGLTIAAWPGWLQIGTPGPRSLEIQTDPSLERAAQQIALWRREGTLPWKGNGFNLSPDSANFFAWFCPEEHGFITSHLAVSDTVLWDYMTVRQALIGPQSRDWRGILRKRKIDHLFLFGSDRRLVRAALRKILANSQEWPLLYVGGSMIIVGWRDPGSAADPFQGLELDLDHLAFCPTAREAAAPQTRPAREPLPFFWWQAFWRPRGQRSVDQEQAVGFLELFEMLGPSRGRKNEAFLLVNQVGSGYAGGVPFLFAPWQSRVLLDYLHEGPPGALFLAIHAARRALHDHPDNPKTHFALGEAYYFLTRKTRERIWIKSFPHLGRIRTVQMIAGYRQALRLNPDHVRAHLRLGEIYLGMYYKDTALEHFQAVLGIMTRHGPAPGENPDQFRQRYQAVRAQVESLSQEVKKLQEKYEINSQNMRLVDRAQLAGNFGLTSQTLNSLLASDISAFGVDGLELELKMLINVGRSATVREWMEPEHEKKLGQAKAHWLHVQLAAASGDYHVADQHLADMTAGLGAIKKLTIRKGTALRMGQAVLEAKPDPTLLPFLWFQASRLNDEANNHILQGLLAMEAANPSRAREQFHQAYQFWVSPAGIPFQKGSPEARAGLDIARYYLSLLPEAP
jgi:tetratricopeptide (TPR) repeat protein